MSRDGVFVWDGSLSGGSLSEGLCPGVSFQEDICPEWTQV